MTNYDGTNIVNPTIGAWATMDLTGIVPAGTVAIGVRIRNVDNGASWRWGLGKYGATRPGLGYCRLSTQSFQVVALDSSLRCEGYREDAGIRFDLIWAMNASDGIVMFDNPIDYTPVTTSAYVDATFSEVPANSIACVLYARNSGGIPTSGLRIKGSSDDHKGGGGSWGGVVGVDSNKKCEIYTSSLTATKFYLLGYINNATLKVNGLDKTPASLNSWVNVDVSADAAAGAFAVMYEPFNNAGVGDYKGSHRYDGSSDATTSNCAIFCCGRIAGLVGNIFEAYHGHSSVKLNVNGYIALPRGAYYYEMVNG